MSDFWSDMKKLWRALGGGIARVKRSRKGNGLLDRIREELRR